MGHPLLCTTVAAPDLRELRRQRDAAFGTGDMVEVRLDALVGVPDVDAALAGRAGPVIVTCRPAWEGGGFKGPEDERLALLRRALDLGADYVDVEWRADYRALVAARGGRGIVLSSHEFQAVPRDLASRYRDMRATGAEVVKIAVPARSLADNLPLLELGRGAMIGGERVSLVGMGTPGLPSRILAARFGCCWTYAGDAVAPGQLPAADLLDAYRFRDTTATTAVYGVVGRPIGHSLSPVVHNAAFRARGVDAVFLPLEAADAADFHAFASALGMAGASVTAPLKVDVLPYVAVLDNLSRRAGAVNTIRMSGATWEGRNTDVPGFLAPLAGRLELATARVSVLGAGGAARAAALALAERGARVTVHSRVLARGQEVAAMAGGRATLALPAAGGWDVLVNATPVGTFPDVDALPVPAHSLGGGLVYDLVYNPPVTALCRAAQAAGCPTIGGLEMFVEQAALQFEWWTRVAAPRQVMRDRALAALARPAGGPGTLDSSETGHVRG